MMSLVAIENGVNGRKGFGMTSLTPEQYMNNRIKSAIKDNPNLAKEVEEYGLEAFKCYPVMTGIVNKKVANDMKNFLIDEYNSHSLEGGYNTQYSEKHARLGRERYNEHIYNHSGLNAKENAEPDAFKLSLCHRVDNSRPYYVYRQQTSAA